MMRPNGVAARMLSEVEAAVDWVRYQMRGQRERGPYRIVAYRGHGTHERLYVKGRVLRGRSIPPASEHDPAWRNLVNTLRRLESDEVPAARVRARVGQAVVEALADDEGYFQCEIPVLTTDTDREVWRRVELELLDPVGEEGAARATCFALVPSREARFGVISDIDDTVVKTDVTNLLSMLRLVFLTNARTRLPFEGVAAFYRALACGRAGPHTNPVFYVSSSPWSLYELLQEVFQVHGIPEGTLFLRDYGLSRDMLFSTSHREHKLAAIDHILTTHPQLQFVLLGDSGQHDPEIYCEAVRRHPGRVRAIYIRDVTQGTRDDAVRGIVAELAAQGVEMVFAEDTISAALHAAGRGLIDPSSIPDVQGEKARDEAAPGPLQSAVTEPVAKVVESVEDAVKE